MPYIRIRDKNIYYKEYGKGEPIVFLNGVMMGTNSWSPFIPIVSKEYRMITVDLLDQGKSDNYEGEYSIDTQVQIFKYFLDQLKLNKVHLIGMSYGGKVAQSFAIKYEDRIKSLILSNTTSYTTNIMKDMGKGWDFAASTLNGTIFSSIIMPYMYSSNYYEKNYQDIKIREKVFSNILNENWYKRFKRILNSGKNYNVLNQIKSIKVPTLIISSEFDRITPLKYQQLINEQINDSKWVIIEDSGHASIYEKPKEFISTIMNFV